MPDETKRLLFPSEPFTDESHTGYLLRLLQLNDYDSLSWILQMTHVKDRARSRYNFALNSSLDLVLLSRITGVDVSKLEGLPYRPVRSSRKRLIGDYSVFGSPLPQYLIRLGQPKICPKCLQENEYARKVWDIATVTACPLHNCLLLDECPSCHKCIVWNRRWISICRCMFDWRNHLPIRVDTSALRVVRRIYQLCNLPAGVLPVGQRETIDNSYLLKLGLKDFVSALLFIASQYAGIIDTKGKHLVPRRKNAELHELFCKALHVFDDWPNNYFAFLDWRRSQKESRKQPDKATQGDERGWHKDFGEYKSALYIQLGSSQFSFMRRTFREYINERRREERLAEAQLRNVSDEPYISQREAERVLGIDSARIEKLIGSGRLKGYIVDGGKRRIFMIGRESAERLKKELDGSLFLKEVKGILGLDTTCLVKLAKCGVLKPILNPGVDGGSLWQFSRKEVDGLLQTFTDKLSLTNGTESEGTINEGLLSLNSTLRIVYNSCISLQTFIEDVHRGKIKPRGVIEGIGLHKFAFSEREVSRYARAKLRSRIGNAMQVQEAAKVLEMSEAAVRLLIKKGFISAERLADAPSLGLVITQEGIGSFNKTYISSWKLARMHGSNSKFVVELLAAQGINPVSGPKTDGGLLSLFKTSELGNLNFTDLMSKEISRRNSERRFQRILNEKQVAESLETDVNTVQQLVKNGALKPYKRLSQNKGDGTECYFSQYTIERYTKRSDGYINLVAFLTVVGIFGLYPDNFYNKYIETGRLKPVLTGRKRSEYYFSRKDVEELLHAEGQIIITPEAAEILGVNSSCVDKMIASGVLNPISGPSVDGFGKNLFLRSDVEKLHVEREAFKTKRVKEGGTARFGKQSGSQSSPVQDVIGPRIDQLIEEWHERTQDQRITGEGLYKQLKREGYELGINTVYVYLRQKHRQAT